MTIQDEVNKIKWRQCIDLGNGVITKGTKNTFRDLEEWKFPANLFKNKSVVDIGADDGCFSFLSEKMGADKVLAIDPYRWLFDTTRWSGQNGFNLARKILNSKVEDSVLPLEEIGVDTIGQWDVALFLGVFYHLPFPCFILDKVASVCTDTLVVETLIDPEMETINQPVLKFWPYGFHSDISTYWTPNTLFLNSYLKKLGFQDVHTRIIYNGYRSISYASNKKKEYKVGWGNYE